MLLDLLFRLNAYLYLDSDSNSWVTVSKIKYDHIDSSNIRILVTISWSLKFFLLVFDRPKTGFSKNLVNGSTFEIYNDVWVLDIFLSKNPTFL